MLPKTPALPLPQPPHKLQHPISCALASSPHPGFIQTAYLHFLSPYLHHPPSHRPHSIRGSLRNYSNQGSGSPTMSPTKRCHYNLVILKFSSIQKKVKIIIKVKEKWTFFSLNTQSVLSLISGTFPYPAPPLQSRGSSEMSSSPVSHTRIFSTVGACPIFLNLDLLH